MNPLFACVMIGLAGLALAEPPVSSGYSYSRPSGGGGYSSGGGGGGYSSGGGGYSSGGGGGGYSSGGGGYSSGGGASGYQQVASGYQTNEGASVDGALLEQIRQILLKEEAQSQSSGGFGASGYAPSSSYGAPSSSYGAPSSSYGVPSSYQSRVVGIDLEGIRQAIQVAQFNQVTQGSGGGYSSGPSSNYGAPSRQPSGSYGAPY